MPDPFTLCGQATRGWPACRAGGLWPSSTPLGTQRRTPMDEGRMKLQNEMIFSVTMINQNVHDEILFENQRSFIISLTKLEGRQRQHVILMKGRISCRISCRIPIMSGAFAFPAVACAVHVNSRDLILKIRWNRRIWHRLWFWWLQN
jgi:hypothetical protein